MAKTKAPTALPTLHRAMAIELDAYASRADTADERIPVALSSETPVERWFGREILDHSADAVDLSRAEEGLPLLDAHDAYSSVRKQVGVIEDVHVGKDRKIRGMMRFSKRTEAQELKRDVEDGIIRNVSIGYRIDELKLEESAKDEGDTYRATRWSLLEGSLVSVPADHTVGVGRSTVAGAETPVRIVTPEPTQPAPEAREHTMSEQDKAPTGAAPVTVKDTRAQDLAAIAREYKASERLAEWIEKGTSTEAALRELASSRLAEPKPIAPAKLAVEDYEREGRAFSISRAIQAAQTGDWSEAGFEREVSVDLAKRTGQKVAKNTFLMPSVRKLSEREMETRAAQKVGTSTSGGHLVFTEYGGFIDALRNRSVVMGLGATVLPGLQGNVAFPRQTSSTTAYWMAENSGSDVTESNLAVDQVTLSPKTLMARSRYTNQLLAQGVLNIDAMLQADIAQVLALEIDRAALHGSGASNQPQGIYGATDVNSVAFGGAITYVNVTKLLEAIEIDNAAIGEFGIVTTPQAAQDAMTTQKFSSTNGEPVWLGSFAAGSMAGVKAVASNQVASNLGAGTNEHGIIAGVWSQLLIGEWGAVAITVDPYTLAGQDEVRIIARQFVDIDLRQPKAFATGSGLTVS